MSPSDSESCMPHMPAIIRSSADVSGGAGISIGGPARGLVFGVEPVEREQEDLLDVVNHQLYYLRIKISQEMPSYAQGRYDDKESFVFRMMVDNGSCTSWLFGYNYRLLQESKSGERNEVPRDETGAVDFAAIRNFVRPSDSRTTRPVVFDHAYASRDPLDFDRYATHGLVKYVDGSCVVLTLQQNSMKFEILNGFSFARLRWATKTRMHLRWGIAYAASIGFTYGRVDGIIGLGLKSYQDGFSNIVDATTAPSFLSVLRKHLPEVTSDEGGLIMYCAIRPFYGRHPETKVKQLHPFESWIAFNRWPIPHSSGMRAHWSPPIPVISNQWGPWAVRLLSMTFEQYNEDTKKYETIHGSTITFGDGLVVAIDLGSSVSWVPPVLVRHIRTKVFPTQYNLDRDTELKDSPSSLKQGPAFLVQGRIHTKRIKYEFVGADNDAVEVFGPVDQFICVEAHSRDANAPVEEVVREGLLFVYDTKRWPDSNMAVFGLNFFQSMFISFHQPVMHYGEPYVKMMPQWADKRALFKLPPA